jgi:hypothetical protein
MLEGPFLLTGDFGFDVYFEAVLDLCFGFAGSLGFSGLSSLATCAACCIILSR